MGRYKLHFIAPTTGIHVYEFVESMTMIPITPLTLAALTPSNYDIRIIDETIEPIVPKPCDLAAISVMYFNVEKTYKLAQWYRERNIPVIMGGTHATLCPEEVMQHCDAVVVGEVDDIWKDILADFEKKQLKRIYRQSVPPDLTKTPIPRYDLIDKRKYNVQNLIQTGRGCSFGCDFCAIPLLNGRVSRHKTVAQVIAEIETSMQSSSGMMKRIIFFSDDNIVDDPAYARELFQALIPLKVLWASQCSLTIAYNDELLDLATRSGCIGLFIGFETASQDALNEVHKRYDAAKYVEYIRKIKARRIFILGSFLFGLDDHTPDVFKRTVDFCMDNNIDFVNFHLVGPTPGTPFFRKMEQEGRLLHREWKYYQENALYKPAKMTIRELQEGQLWAYEEYVKLGNIFRRVLRHGWPIGHLFVNVVGNLRFRRKVLAGIRHQRAFLPYYNREVLKIEG